MWSPSHVFVIKERKNSNVLVFFLFDCIQLFPPVQKCTLFKRFFLCLFLRWIQRYYKIRILIRSLYPLFVCFRNKSVPMPGGNLCLNEHEIVRRERERDLKKMFVSKIFHFFFKSFLSQVRLGKMSLLEINFIPKENNYCSVNFCSFAKKGILIFPSMTTFSRQALRHIWNIFRSFLFAS